MICCHVRRLRRLLGICNHLVHLWHTEIKFWKQTASDISPAMQSQSCLVPTDLERYRGIGSIISKRRCKSMPDLLSHLMVCSNACHGATALGGLCVHTAGCPALRGRRQSFSSSAPRSLQDRSRSDGTFSRFAPSPLRQPYDSQSRRPSPGPCVACSYSDPHRRTHCECRGQAARGRPI